MAYDEATAARIRSILARGAHDLTEKKMFGGLCFMVAGHMCCGLTTTELMLRVGKAAYPEVIALRHARPMTFTGRPMDGFIYVDPAGYRTDAALAAWLARGVAHVETLPRRVATRPSRTVAATRSSTKTPATKTPAAKKPAAKKPAAKKPAAKATPTTTAKRTTAKRATAPRSTRR